MNKNATDPFAGMTEKEVRVIAPDYTLKKIIGEDVDVKQIFNSENIEKAQSVINDHKDNFLEWVMTDIEQLKQYYANAVANPESAAPEIHKLGRAAFIIKSQAGTFGFSLATQVAKSLDDFCTRHPKPAQEHFIVIRKHIDTLVAIFDKNITGDGGAMGRELTDSLFKLAAKYEQLI